MAQIAVRTVHELLSADSGGHVDTLVFNGVVDTTDPGTGLRVRPCLVTLARRLAPPAPGRALTLALTALVALVLDRALAAYADSVHWTRATPNDWITTAALSFIGAGIILHVGIGLRWPFAQKTKENNP